MIEIFANFPGAVFQRDVIAGVREVIDQSGYEAAVMEVPVPPARIADLPMPEERLAGVLVVTGVLPDAVLYELGERAIPMSLVSHQIPGEHIPGVMPNNRQGIAMLMEHLVLECGCRQPVFIGGILSQTDGYQRHNAFQQEVMRYNLHVPPEHYLRGDFSPDIAAASMREFLASGAAFDAVVASDYLMAEAAMHKIQMSGRRIPDEVAVVGFGDGPEAALAGITTVAADVTELGRRAARQLIGQINGLRIRGLTLLSTELIERDTTRAIE
ncbi:MAG: substrate-binding domain-containing protein [Anaerolineae bacterium]